MTRPVYEVHIDWDNDGNYTDAGEDITARVLARTPIKIQYGRDQARSLSPLSPGRASFEVNNSSGDYSPENASSPLDGHLRPGRPVRIQATHNGTTYVLYRGFLDDYQMRPEIERRSVEFTALDALARIRGATISTALHPSVQTGQAIHLILDELDWPTSARDIDPGATTIRWWYEESADAYEAMKRVVEAEGLPALLTVNVDGDFIFRDRHHRILSAASTNSQATFRGSGAEPVFSPPLQYDLGWRDIVNSVTFTVEERRGAPDPIDVWQSDATYTLDVGQTILVTAKTIELFVNAIVPVVNTDYTMLTGTVSMTLSRTEAHSVTIFITAVGAGASLTNLKLRAYPLIVTSTQEVAAQNGSSIEQYGRRSYGEGIQWVGRNDAVALAEIILAHRAERMPIVEMTITGTGTDLRVAQQLGRDLSDRVTIIETGSNLNADFYVEQIAHTTDGMFHTTVFGCEKALEVGGGFALDTDLLDTGVLGASGIDNPATVLLLNTGVLNTKVLAT